MANHDILPIFAQEVDKVAKEDPQRLFAAVPKENWQQNGWQDITFAQVSNSINYISNWLDEILGPAKDFPTIAYTGPNDLRYTFMLGAAMKTRRKILYTDVIGLSQEARHHILDATSCQVLIAAEGHTQIFQDLVSHRSGCRLEVIPSFMDCLNAKNVPFYQFDEPFSQILHHPWNVIHTSGTTGLPKVYTKTYQMQKMTQDVYSYISNADEETSFSRFRDTRALITSSFFWALGISAVSSMVTMLRLIPVLLPPDAPRPAQAAYVEQVQLKAPISTAIYSPALLKDFSKSPSALERLSQLNIVWYAGAALDKWTGDILSQYVHVASLVGSTEAGGIVSYLNAREDFQYIKPHPVLGAHMEYRDTDGLYELVLNKQKEYQLPLFVMYPDIEQYRTNDLFERHPTKPEWFKMVGRADDFVKLSSLDRFNAAEVENELEKSSRIKTALMGGDGRKTPFVLIEPYEKPNDAAGQTDDLDTEVSKAIERINSTSSQRVQIPKQLVIFSDPGRPFPRLGKGTLNRRATLSLYEEDIQSAYNAIEV